MVVTQNSIPQSLVDKAQENPETEHLIVPILNQVMSESNQLSCTLENELTLVQNYLSLAQKEDSSLTVNYEIDNTIKQDEISVPLRMIQIIVANAVDIKLSALKTQKVLNLAALHEGTNTIIKITDNGGGYVVRQSEGQKGMEAMMRIVELLNKCNQNEIEIAFHTVWLRNGEKGCETKITLPNDYTFEL
jgi:LytS/YehU family sensor histidine kinase